MRLLILDNYDSFTYNLYDYACRVQAGFEIDVIRHDMITLEEAAVYDAFIFSPGPGLPPDAGILLPLIAQVCDTKPSLGVCLGLQAIAMVYGARLKNLTQVTHGLARANNILILDDPLYESIENPFIAGRYHSWVVDQCTLPDSLSITATDEMGEIMSLSHENGYCFAVQYHPESIMTPQGQLIISNFLNIAKEKILANR